MQISFQFCGVLAHPPTHSDFLTSNLNFSDMDCNFFYITKCYIAQITILCFIVRKTIKPD